MRVARINYIMIWCPNHPTGHVSELSDARIALAYDRIKDEVRLVGYCHCGEEHVLMEAEAT